MTGSRAEAEDAVAEAYARAREPPAPSSRSPRSRLWLAPTGGGAPTALTPVRDRRRSRRGRWRLPTAPCRGRPVVTLP